MLILALGLMSVFAHVTAQDCSTLIGQCFGDALPDSRQDEAQELWTRVCSASGAARPCLDNISGRCELDAVIVQRAYGHMCTLEYEDFMVALNCSDAATTSIEFRRCMGAARYLDGFSVFEGPGDCSFREAIAACADTSFEKECGDSASVMGAVFKDALIISSQVTLDALGLDYSNCTFLTDMNALSSPSEPEADDVSCSRQIEACYGEISIDTLVDATIPLAARQAIYVSFCATERSTWHCLERIIGDDDCRDQIEPARDTHGIICGFSFEDVTSAYTCKASLPEARVDSCAGLVTYDGHSDLGIFRCNFYTRYVLCLVSLVDEVCADRVEFSANAVEIVKLLFYLQLTAIERDVPSSSFCPITLIFEEVSIANLESHDICNLEIGTCYQAYEAYGILPYRTWYGIGEPSAAEEAQWKSFCSNQNNIAGCLLELNANQDCLQAIQGVRNFYGHACTKSYSEYYAAVRCIFDSTHFIVHEPGCINITRSQTTDRAEYECRYAAQRTHCDIAHMARTCDPNTFPFAQRLFVCLTKYERRLEGRHECPSLRAEDACALPQAVEEYTSASIRNTVTVKMVLLILLIVRALTP